MAVTFLWILFLLVADGYGMSSMPSQYRTKYTREDKEHLKQQLENLKRELDNAIAQDDESNKEYSAGDDYNPSLPMISTPMTPMEPTSDQYPDPPPPLSYPDLISPVSYPDPPPPLSYPDLPPPLSYPDLPPPLSYPDPPPPLSYPDLISPVSYPDPPPPVSYPDPPPSESYPGHPPTMSRPTAKQERCDFQCKKEYKPRCAYHPKGGMLISAGRCQMEKDYCERGVHDISGAVYRDINIQKLKSGFYRNTKGMHIIRSSKTKGKLRKRPY